MLPPTSLRRRWDFAQVLSRPRGLSATVNPSSASTSAPAIANLAVHLAEMLLISVSSAQLGQPVLSSVTYGILKV